MGGLPDKVTRLAGDATRKISSAVKRRSYRWTLTFVRDRGDLPYLLNARRLLGCGAEIGCQRGNYSNLLLSRWKGAHLLSIDPWAAAPEDEYVDASNVSQAEHDVRCAEAGRKLARYGDRSSVWRTTSAEAVAKVPQHSLDFVYIDARHDYASVKEDLELWYPRVRPHGFLAGHDYLDGDLLRGAFGVKRAVDELCEQHGLTPHVTDEGPCSSWIIEVPAPPVPPRLPREAVPAAPSTVQPAAGQS